MPSIRKPAPGKGRDRRLGADEEKTLLRACDCHSNPMLGWIVRVALYFSMRAGDVRFERHRDDRGRMRGGTYIVSEVPAPVPASSDAAEPDRAVPATVLPGALQKTDRDPGTTTTNRPTDTNRGTGVNRHRQALQFPEWVPHEIRTSTQHLVAELDQADAQLVIDEWAGALAAGRIQRSPLGYLKTLATRNQTGSSEPTGADRRSHRNARRGLMPGQNGGSSAPATHPGPPCGGLVR